MPSPHPILEHLQAIIEVQSRVSAVGLDLGAFMQEVVDAVERLTGAQASIVELAEGEDMVYRCTSASIGHTLGMRIKRDGSLSGLCVTQGKVLRCDDTDQDERVNQAACREVGVRSMICTPLFQRGQAMGVLKVMSGQTHGFNEYDVQTLTMMAGVLGSALGKQLAFEAKNRVEAELRESQAHAQASETRLKAMLEQANDAVVSMDERGLITEWNHAAERLLGWTAEEALGCEMTELIIPADQRQARQASLARFLKTPARQVMNQRLELKVLDKAGEDLLVELSLSAVRVGERWEFLSFMHDITERKQLEHQLHQMAREDSLTGLTNRRGFMETIDRALARVRRHGHAVALLYMDLNGFKQINDVHGHEAGDRALQEFARRIGKVVRGSDTVSRLGGDEFAVLAEGIAHIGEALALADKVRACLLAPMSDPDVQLRTSIGIALYNGQANASALLRDADEAMYADKKGLSVERQVQHGPWQGSALAAG